MPCVTSWASVRTKHRCKYSRRASGVWELCGPWPVIISLQGCCVKNRKKLNEANASRNDQLIDIFPDGHAHKNVWCNNAVHHEIFQKQNNSQLNDFFFQFWPFTFVIFNSHSAQLFYQAIMSVSQQLFGTKTRNYWLIVLAPVNNLWSWCVESRTKWASILAVNWQWTGSKVSSAQDSMMQLVSYSKISICCLAGWVILRQRGKKAVAFFLRMGTIIHVSKKNEHN